MPHTQAQPTSHSKRPPVPPSARLPARPSARPPARPPARPVLRAPARAAGNASSVTASRSNHRRIHNMLLGGGGAETLQDRSSRSFASYSTLHPYFNTNAPARWQEYTRWYMTAWEARKIIDIPVEDALRKAPELRGLDPEDERALIAACEKFKLTEQLRRALVQERLLGGALLMPLLLRPRGDDPASPLEPASIVRGDLVGINVVDISRLSRPPACTDPFSPYFDREEHILISGDALHMTRCHLLDGAALFSRASQSIMEPARFNASGFGESKLAPLYDLLGRVVGTQQGAYHLVNMASCLLVEVENLRSVMAADSPALYKMQEICEQLSIYRGAVIDGKGARVSQHSATFGSVPELVMTFAQLLSAASDIPATRFLGQAPGGLNATGEGDQQNYYDMVSAYQRLHLMPAQRACIDWIGAHLFGGRAWQEKSKELTIVYPPLKALGEKEEAEVANTYASMLKNLADSGVIRREDAAAELTARGLFRGEVQTPEGAAEEEKATEATAGKEADGEKTGAAEMPPHIINSGATFDESKVNRDDIGRFAEKPGETSGHKKGAEGKAKDKTTQSEAQPEATSATHETESQSPQDFVTGSGPEEAAEAKQDTSGPNLSEDVTSKDTAKESSLNYWEAFTEEWNVSPESEAFTKAFATRAAELGYEGLISTSRLIYGTIGALAGGLVFREDRQFLFDVIKSLPEYHDSFAKAMNDLDRARTPEAQGKALADFIAVASVVFAPELAARKGAPSPKVAGRKAPATPPIPPGIAKPPAPRTLAIKPPAGIFRHISSAELITSIAYATADSRALQKVFDAERAAGSHGKLKVASAGRINGKAVVETADGAPALGQGVKGENLYVRRNQKSNKNLTSEPTLIYEEAVISGKKRYGERAQYPNDRLSNAHAEIAFLQKAHDAGLIKKGDTVTLSVVGQKVCVNCKEHIPAMANKLGLRFVTIIDKTGGVVYYWHKSMFKLERIK